MSKPRSVLGAHRTKFKSVGNYEDLIYQRITLDEYLAQDTEQEVRPIRTQADREPEPQLAEQAAER